MDTRLRLTCNIPPEVGIQERTTSQHRNHPTKNLMRWYSLSAPPGGPFSRDSRHVYGSNLRVREDYGSTFPK